MAEIGRRLFAAVESAFPQAAAHIDDSPVMRHQGEKVSFAAASRVLPGIPGSEEAIACNSKRRCRRRKLFAHFCKEVERNEKIPGRPGPYDSKLHHFVLIQNNKAVVARYHDQNDTSFAGGGTPRPAAG